MFYVELYINFSVIDNKHISRGIVGLNITDNSNVEEEVFLEYFSKNYVNHDIFHQTLEYANKLLITFCNDNKVVFGYSNRVNNLLTDNVLHFSLHVDKVDYNEKFYIMICDMLLPDVNSAIQLYLMQWKVKNYDNRNFTLSNFICFKSFYNRGKNMNYQILILNFFEAINMLQITISLERLLPQFIFCN